MRRLTLLISAVVLLIAACTTTPTSTPSPSLVTVYPTTTRATTNTPQPTATATSLPASATATQPAVSTTIPATASETPYPLPKISLANEGVNVVDYGNANIDALKPLGFGWLQVFNPPDFPIFGHKVLYRVPLGNAITGKREDIDAWADALESLARERKSIINAYAIGNEVNLAREWGGNPPDPLLYTKLLAVGYARVKTADPDALVISAGLAPTGGDAQGALDDLNYARAMFEAGAADVLDGYGFHPYGFASEPERNPNDASAKGLLFRRAEAHRKLMEEFGIGNKQMWATEFGWIIDAKEEGQTCVWPGLDWQRVSRKRQAEYVVRAYDYAAKNWLWMGPMFLWNYDFSRASQYPDACEQMKFFSMLDEAGKERPVFAALRTASSKP